MAIDKILVPVDFSPCSDAALDYALAVADECGAEVEVLHVWSPRERKTPIPSGSADAVDLDEAPTSEIFAETPEGVAMEQRLSAAEWKHPARVSGRLEFGEEPSLVILAILERERFDLVVMGSEGEGHRHGVRDRENAAESGLENGHVAATVAKTAPCKVVTRPPPAPTSDEDEAA
jgi:nucleotide-binding universal stress UspA family protein